MAAPFLHQGEQSAVLRPQLGERVAQGIEFLRVHGARRFGDVFVLLAKREENPAQLLTPQLVNAGVAREPEEPRFELRGSLQANQRANHLDENLLGQVLDVVTSSSHGVNKTGHPTLVADNELMLGDLVALLSPADQVSQRRR